MTPAPKTPGIMNLIKRRTAAVRRGQGSDNAMPARAHDTMSQRNWANPARVSAQASASAVRPGQSREVPSAAMRKMLSSIGVAAVAAKCSTEFRTPPCSDTSEMSSR